MYEYKDSQFRKTVDLFSKFQVLPSLSQRVETKPLVAFKCRRRKWWFILQTSGAVHEKKKNYSQSLFLIKIGSANSD